MTFMPPKHKEKMTMINHFHLIQLHKKAKTIFTTILVIDVLQLRNSNSAIYTSIKQFEILMMCLSCMTSMSSLLNFMVFSTEFLNAKNFIGWEIFQVCNVSQHYKLFDYKLIELTIKIIIPVQNYWFNYKLYFVYTVTLV